MFAVTKTILPMKKQPIQFRQGDLLFEQITKLPINLKKAKNNILALGETSGHGHQAFDCEVMEDEKGEKYLTVEEEAAIRHLLVESGVWTKEHKEVTLPKGKYRVIQQNEYNPYLKAIQKVRD